MIVKKPYAFLIKNFRVLHGLLFGLLFYLTIKLLSIVSFFNSYATEGYYTNASDLASSYINYAMFVVLILSLLFVLIIYFILNIKKKESKLYLFIFIYLVIVFVFLIYFFSVFQGLQVEPLKTETVRAYRDICIMVQIPSFVFLAMVLGRTFGFNLKQFDFKGDLEEIEVNQEDNAEVELTLGNDTYKFARAFRKALRLTKYFVLENRIFVIGFSSIIVLILTLSIFLKLNVYGASYDENQQILANNLWYKINSSYYTINGIHNEIVNKNKTYILVKVEINNKSLKNYTLTRETFKLIVDGKEVIPTFGLDSKFKDIATVFTPVEIESKALETYLIVFEIDPKYLESDYILKIKNFDEKSVGTIESEYKEVIIKPINLDSIIDKGNYNLPANLKFADNLLDGSSLIIGNYEISDKFKETYSSCVKSDCRDIKYVVTPNNVGKGSLSVLKLKTTLEINDKLYIKKYINNANDIFYFYGYIRYKYASNYYNKNIDKINTKYNSDKYTYLSVPSEIKYADKIELILVIRGQKYTINLK